MEYFKEWCDDLLNITSGIWEHSLSVRGECCRHTGPSVWFAAVTINFSPNHQFEVADELDAEVKKIARDNGWYDYIIFGVLDTMFTYPERSIRNFKLTILQIEFNEIESNPMAFRLAARNAAAQALEIHFRK